jgi:hypothetical protein
LNTTAQHQKLAEEASLPQRREQARDRLLLAITDALGIALAHSYSLVGHDPRYEGIQRELRDAKLIFAGTLDKP